MVFVSSKFNRPSRRAIPVLILTLLLSFAVESRTIGGLNMFETKKTKAAAGKWGGTGVGLTVEETAVGVGFDCAAAEIARSLMMDKAGNFIAEGVYIRRPPGALTTKFPPQRAPARFEGKISGKTEPLRITLTETDEKVGDFTSERGKTPTVRKCA